jgi:hypothetical protein
VALGLRNLCALGAAIRGLGDVLLFPKLGLPVIVKIAGHQGKPSRLTQESPGKGDFGA